MEREEFELCLECEPQPLERTARRERQSRERAFELIRRLLEHGLKEPALGVVVVEQQLFVDAGATDDLLHARAREAASCELFAGNRDDP